MSKFIKILIIGISITTITITSVIANAQSNFDKTKKYSEMSEKEIKNELNKLDSDDLVSEVNKVMAEGKIVNDYNSTIPVVSALADRKDELKNNEIIDMIKSNKFNLETKEVLVDIYNNKSSIDKNDKELKDLLYEDEIDDKLKQRITNIVEFNSEDMPLLEGMINKGGLNAFYALKGASKIDTKKAYEISKNIIANNKNKTEEEVSGAILVTSKYLKEKKNNKENINKEMEEFLDESLEIFNDSSNRSIKDAIAYSISDIKSEKTIKSLLKDYKLDNEVKMFAIDQNYMILENILKNNPSEDDIYMVIESMKTLPIKDFEDEFKGLLESQSNNKLLKEINSVLDLINKQGIDANKKWLED